ncbi:MAG TPA: M56 family metallopeptidase [Tepidisphaeraceae bacterium]|nr:M56 family metallopeptidase [Tepidisphaeraceae bacterium]
MVTLLESQAIQIALVIALIGATSMLLKRWPHVVYALWLVALAKCLTPPLWSSPTGLFSLAQARTSQVAADQSMSSNAAVSSIAGAQNDRISPLAAPEIAPAVLTSRRRVDWATIVVMLWLSGSGAVLVATAAASHRLLRRLLRNAVACPPELDEMIQSICKELGRKRSARLIIADADFGPAVVAILRPTIVLPVRLLEASPQALRVALGHELSHLRRGDAFLAAAQRLAVAIWWFHPLVWFMSARLTAIREQCCDEETICSLKLDAALYAQTLLDVARGRSARSISLYPGVHAMQVTRRRIGHLMDRKSQFHRRAPKAVWPIFAVGLLILLPGAATSCRPAAQSVAQRNTTPTEVKPTARVADAQKIDPATAKQLDRTLPQLHFTGVGFGDTIDFMRDVSGINIVVDWANLGVDRNEPITLKLDNVKFSKALTLLFAEASDKNARLDYRVDGNTLLVAQANRLNAFAAAVRQGEVKMSNQRQSGG